MTTAHTFQIGKKYPTRNGRTFKVIARTAKSITIEDERGDTSRVGIRVWQDRESALPLGTDSMSPIIFANRVEA